jgi:hypothetical protein
MIRHANHERSRRNVILGAAGLGLAAPFAFAPAMAHARSIQAPDYSGHPAVGIWLETIPDYPYAVNKYAYGVVNSDGTTFEYNPWVAYYLGHDLGLDLGDTKLPTFMFGVWRPTGERTTESKARYAWGDTSSTLLGTAWGKGEISEDGNTSTWQYRITLVDAEGNVVFEDWGLSQGERLQVEPFDEPITPEATPGT